MKDRNILKRFADWTFDVKPPWVGFIVFASAMLPAALLVTFLIIAQPSIFLLAVLIAVIYVWVVAIFFQDKG